MWADACASAFNYLAQAKQVKTPVLPSLIQPQSKLSDLRQNGNYTRVTRKVN